MDDASTPQLLSCFFDQYWALMGSRLQGIAALQAIGLANPEASANLRRVYFHS